MEDVIEVNDQVYVLAGSSRADDRTRVLKQDETFAVHDRFGDFQRLGLGEQGLFHQGTRHLSFLELRINGQRPLLLNSSVSEDNRELIVDLTMPELAAAGWHMPGHSLHILRRKLLWEGTLHESVRLYNYGEHSLELDLELAFAADFADIFEVRGLKRARRGELLPAEIGKREVRLGYRGLDTVERYTRLSFNRDPLELEAGRARFRLRVTPRHCVELNLALGCEAGEAKGGRLSFAKAARRSAERLAAEHAGVGRVFTSNEQFNDWLNRSAADLRMLTSQTREGPYPYAGVPWFSTPFGRDGLITALQYLWLAPALARGVLAFLAARQATGLDPARDAEPGKILHELRRGEMAALGEIPFGRYYGSVDSTPLFLVLAGAYYERSGDRPFLEAIWPHLEAALAWIDDYGDSDGDGFVDYQRHAERGLVQQGWKDSDDSVFHADGSDAEGPIALCEVQGYVYAAKRSAARLAVLFGEHGRAEALERQAADLKRRFNEAFWVEELGTYALALDGDGRPCAVRASNAGHALFSGIASREYARQVAHVLLDEHSFSGWGVRTLAQGEARYNPMSYHNGSVWPHDNGLIAAGLARYGFRDEAMRIMTGLFDASIDLDLHRLPELFCGFRRRPHQGPIRYPVACLPQAWASGVVFQLLQACLGLHFSAESPQVRFDHPQLPDYLHRIHIDNLRVGGGVVELELTRHANDVGINVLRKEGAVEVAVVV
ncbi:amylo-alpha-1,6-glucosidase [Thiohalobacter sp. IOR34]|uniref:amylo-alpha-1,6-glucosidase n=1 Tax=Thiohalobacter sp. IOR34 TaxID=3057176 RepID=UPI0025B0F32A|nr:amylo-alpha-1,6-glucosidase [Thiohalobacter sp. IOR34]WJW75897.1 amylo-alpha-1,6-glucosidase [Thiohalobacter sp. IOR34]